jgi:hypothetical protein
MMILNIENRKIEPDVVVMEMHGRITMAVTARKSNGVWHNCSTRDRPK